MKTIEEIRKEIEKLEIQRENSENYGDDEGDAFREGQLYTLRWILEDE